MNITKKLDWLLVVHEHYLKKTGNSKAQCGIKKF